MKKVNNSLADNCFLCKNVLKEWLPAVLANRKNYIAKKGELIIKEGDPVTGVYFVIEGNVKVHKKWGDKELILRFANNGGIFGHRGINTQDSLFPISATALETTSLCYVDIDFFKTTLKVNHDFAYNLLMFYADELHTSEKKMRDLALMPVKSRLAVALFGLKTQFGINADNCINVNLSRQDLAAFTGATYETVFRTINELIQEKLIVIKGKGISILNEEKLFASTLEIS
ncbi:Crp/Fnr family transcriptional regulator [Pedobacter mucosus]|uniref:Crp/Fnr family transcriptional regulator n=1 Tax=Pedobacter mucosus TaxID=2895286 RepID=UPI001EE43689|nr:Crp/Fnr family transcriptional regulator [Pedobacter mucosus]UKT64248.1 Crp/Fnr family transcriptional regulator [Pedobacter mucosus]